MPSLFLAVEQAHPVLSAPIQAAAPHTAATLSPAMQQALEAYGQQAPKTPLALHFPWLAHTFAGIFIFSSLMLIFLLAIQTTKQEGLSGSVGGRVEVAYRARPGMEQQLIRLTSAMATLFVISATLVSLSGF